MTAALYKYPHRVKRKLHHDLVNTHTCNSIPVLLPDLGEREAGRGREGGKEGEGGGMEGGREGGGREGGREGGKRMEKERTLSIS